MRNVEAMKEKSQTDLNERVRIPNESDSTLLDIDAQD